MDQMTGYNAKLIFFRWHQNIIESVWAAVSSKVKTIHVNYDFLTLLSQPSLSGKHLKIDVI